MNEKLHRQGVYWDREIELFDSIYSHRKSGFSRWLDRMFRKDMYQRFEYTIKNAEPIENRSFLDVGCGTGRYVFELVRRGCGHATGIDISEQMIRHCRRTAEDEGAAAKTEFARTDLLEYSPLRPFDVGIAIGLFDYIKDPLPVLQKMRLCVTGSVIASFPRFWTWRAPIRKFRLAIRKCEVHFYSRRRTEMLLRKAGFTHWEIEKVGKLFCVTASAR